MYFGKLLNWYFKPFLDTLFNFWRLVFAFTTYFPYIFSPTLILLKSLKSAFLIAPVHFSNIKLSILKVCLSVIPCLPLTVIWIAAPLDPKISPLIGDTLTPLAYFFNAFLFFFGSNVDGFSRNRALVICKKGIQTTRNKVKAKIILFIIKFLHKKL